MCDGNLEHPLLFKMKCVYKVCEIIQHTPVWYIKEGSLSFLKQLRFFIRRYGKTMHQCQQSDNARLHGRNSSSLVQR